jgi:hypothetical protein
MKTVSSNKGGCGEERPLAGGDLELSLENN